ncbi:DUF3365 domain-containing protein [Malikia sp.]|uniref:Tll0287-like domain-containing protein n=1 Tax=Malikia sp. TaxID=2070706 RepID=UPI00263625CA|nr:DUF3365 domain-containing protein [Malikia sp.]MDD2729062.1 DUF3365 domain-containing protein [Malikia sp.]
MNKSTVLLAASLLPLLSACNALAPNTTQTSTATAPEAAWIGEARQVAGSVPPKLMAVLSAAIQQGGPAHAIGVCQSEAPKMARAASEATGWQIRRVSLGNRNPKAVPDAWERQTLETFDRQQAAGADGSRLERAEVVTENGQQVKRYMRALPVQAACLQCHGTADQLGPGVAARLSELYPQDKGTGYLLGQIRGAMTLRQNLQ